MPRKTKNCGRCKRRKSINKFGVCRSTKDGLNFYCKKCANEKVNEHRRELRLLKSAEKELLAKNGLVARVIAGEARLVAIDPVQRVREAIQKGKRTHEEIAQDAQVGTDQLCDILTTLLLWNKEIRTELVSDTRMYFPIEVKAVDRKPNITSMSLSQFLVSSLGTKGRAA